MTSVAHDTSRFGEDCECRQCEVKRNPFIVKKFKCRCNLCLRKSDPEVERLYINSDHVKTYMGSAVENWKPDIYGNWGIATHFLTVTEIEREQGKLLEENAGDNYPDIEIAVEQFRDTYKRTPPCFRERVSQR